MDNPWRQESSNVSTAEPSGRSPRFPRDRARPTNARGAAMSAGPTPSLSTRRSGARCETTRLINAGASSPGDIAELDSPHGEGRDPRGAVGRRDDQGDHQLYSLG